MRGLTRFLMMVGLMMASAGVALAQRGDLPPVPITAEVTYVVQSLDTLDGIGAYFDVRVGCIREVNELAAGALLQPGDELLISPDCPAYDGTQTVLALRSDTPGADGSDGTYVVRPNDTLDTIGQTLDVSVEAIIAAKAITDNKTIKAGQVLVIPADAPKYGIVPALIYSPGAAASMAGTDGTSRSASAIVERTYVLQRNETLDGVGARFNVNHYCLIERNGITDVRAVSAGTLLIVPEDCGPYTGFDVVPTPTSTPQG